MEKQPIIINLYWFIHNQLQCLMSLFTLEAVFLKKYTANPKFSAMGATEV